jgi:hypothetical protein
MINHPYLLFSTIYGLIHARHLSWFLLFGCSMLQGYTFPSLGFLYLAAFRLPSSSVLLYNTNMLLEFKAKLKVNACDRLVSSKNWCDRSRLSWLVLKMRDNFGVSNLLAPDGDSLSNLQKTCFAHPKAEATSHSKESAIPHSKESAIYMSIHVNKREMLAVSRKVFEIGLSPIEFRVYCQIAYFEQEESFDTSEIAKSCCITEEQVLECFKNLESKGLVKKHDDFLEICEISQAKYFIPTRVVNESCSIDTKRYKALPLRLSCIYVIKSEDNGLVKIGMTTSPRNRIKSIAWKHKLNLEILYLFECAAPKLVESYLHFTFQAKQVKFAGESEWFDLSDKNIADIKTILERSQW